MATPTKPAPVATAAVETPTPSNPATTSAAKPAAKATKVSSVNAPVKPAAATNHKPATKAAKPASTKAKATPRSKPSKKVEPVHAAVQASHETVETVVKTSTEVAKKGVEKVVAISQEQVDAAVKAGTDVFKGYEDAVEFSKSNIDAYVKANEIWTAGMAEVNSAVIEAVQSNIEETVAATKKLMTCTSLADAVAVQADLAKSRYEKSVERSREISSLSAKVAEETAKPIAARVSATVDIASKPIAG